MSSSKTKRVIITFLRTALGVALAGLLLHFTLKSTGADLWNELLESKKLLLVTALLSYGFVLGITVVRWRMLLAVQDIHLGFWTTARLTMIGVFFNIAIPGAVSGDLLKMAYVSRQAPAKKAEAVLTIMLDRVLGVFGLFIVAGTTILVSLPMLIGLGPEYRPIQATVFVVGMGSVVGIVGLLLVELRQRCVSHPQIARIVAFGAEKLPAVVVKTLQRLTSALEIYRSKRLTVIKAVGLSILVHACLGLSLYWIGTSVHEDSLRARDYFLAMQVGNAVGAIPVAPGGLGTRDATIVEFFKAFKATPEKIGVIPLTYSLIIAFWSLTGGLVFIFSSKKRTVSGN